MQVVRIPNGLGRGLGLRVARWMGLLIALLLGVSAAAQGQGTQELRVGSKRFPESYILAEIIAQTSQQAGQPAKISQGLGNTAIVYEALRSGQIDVYADYTGTITQEIVKDPSRTAIAALDRALAPMGLGVGVPLGFNNSYALAMRADQAAALGITSLSDLAKHTELKVGLSNEFIGRADGWRGLAERYGLKQQPRGLDHGLAYEALAQRQIDVMDIYTTDAQISKLGLVLLNDDKAFFPRYDAVLLYRRDLPERLPAAWEALQRLEGGISEETMVTLNAQATLQAQPFDQVAQGFLRFWLGGPSSGTTAEAAAGSASDPVDAAAAGAFPIGEASAPEPMAVPPIVRSPASAPQAMSPGDSAEPAGFLGRFWKRLWAPDLGALIGQHILLVAVSVGLATLIAVPLGVALFPRARARALALGAAGVLQTIPSLALLAVLIAMLGMIGKVPALIALTAYSVLPILSNTCAGLGEIPTGVRHAAAALGMTRQQRLTYVEFPLALPTVLAGIRTATAIAIGTATIAAFIGAGGLGERIVTGLALNDSALLLAGALPAAGLSLLSEALFELIGRRIAARRRPPASVLALAEQRTGRSRSRPESASPSAKRSSSRRRSSSSEPGRQRPPSPVLPSSSALESARPRYGETVPQEAPMWLNEPSADDQDSTRAKLEQARAERPHPQRPPTTDRPRREIQSDGVRPRKP